MFLGCHVFQAINDTFPSEIEIFFHRHTDFTAAHEPSCLFELLFRTTLNTPNDAAMGQYRHSHIRYLVLGNSRHETDNRDDASVRNRVKALLKCAGAAYLQYVSGALVFCDALHLFASIGMRPIVDRVVDAELGFHKFELLVAGRGDDCGCTGSLSKDQAY